MSALFLASENSDLRAVLGKEPDARLSGEAEYGVDANVYS